MHYVRIRQGSASGKLVAEKSFSSRKAAEAFGHKVAEQYQVPAGCVVCVESPAKRRSNNAWRHKPSGGLKPGSLVTMGSKAPYALRGTVGIVRERTTTGRWQVDIGGQLYELPSEAMRKANGRGRFFVEKSESADVPGEVSYFVMDRELDDAVVYTSTFDEAQEIASLLRVYHSPRVSHDAWDEARSRLADYGVSPGARSNSNGASQDFKIGERVRMKHDHWTGHGAPGGTVKGLSHGRVLVQFDDGVLVDVDNRAISREGGARSNPHIPTGAKIIEKGGVLAAPGPKGGWITVGRYQTAVPIRPGGKPSGPGQKTVQFAVLVQDAGASGKSDEFCTTAKQAMEVFTILVGKPAVYKAIQDYQIRQGQRVGVQVRPRPNGGAPPSWPSATEVQTLIFAPGTTSKAAKAWAKAHGFKAGKIDTSGTGTGSVRVRQHPPTDYMPDRFRTIPLTDGVQAVVGVPKRSTGRQHLK